MPDVASFLLEIDPEVDIEFLRTAFDFEIVAEAEDGFVVVAADDLDTRKLEDTLSKLEGNQRGGGSAAKVYELTDGGTDGRLQRVLSDSLYRNWANLGDNVQYVVDVGIECWGKVDPPSPPKPLERGEDEDEASWSKRQVRFHKRQQRFVERWSEAFVEWDTLKSSREDGVRRILAEYGGEVLGLVDDSGAVGTAIPDSFTARVRVIGRGLRDLVLNYPYIFEVQEPDDVERPTEAASGNDTAAFQLLSPSPHAPVVCIVDSGIQENHPLLAAAIDSASSHCYIDGVPIDDTADHVSPHGHGTRVAGAVLYPSEIPAAGSYQAPVWLRNARVLNRDNQIGETTHPGAVLQDVVRDHTALQVPSRIYVHSINATRPCRLVHMSAWAAAIDRLVCEKNIVVVQSAGNLRQSSGTQNFPGVSEHIGSGRNYPEYLYSPSSRLANPAQSLNAITVGSMASGAFTEGSWSSLARQPGAPSAFSRAGFGIWDTIKPDVVEFGGDLAADSGQPPAIAPTLSAMCPDLVRSTLHAVGPAHDRSGIGTSFAAPKVAHIVAAVADAIPGASAQLLRASTIQSARWPNWANSLSPEAQVRLLRSIGFGLPDKERATGGNLNRAMLVAQPGTGIGAREGHIYQVRIPEGLRESGETFDVLIEVTLAFAALPRRTRRHNRNYLSTWVDWHSSKANESINSFIARALHDSEAATGETGSTMRWMLDQRKDSGVLPDVRRNRGTAQKDWCLVQSHQLPRDFCIAVVGHEGWDKRPEATVPYALCVTLEALNPSVPVHEYIRVGVEELRVELGVDVTVRT